MRKQIVAANWKMNGTLEQANSLLDAFAAAPLTVNENKIAVFAVPAPYLMLAKEKLSGNPYLQAAAQNCYSKKSGAYTGEISVEILRSIGISYVVLGHSERREYFAESNAFLAEKVNIALAYNITPIFCCGEPLAIREAETQNAYVATQLEESLFHLSAEEVAKIVIAYEPIWAIGTGKTASSAQAQEMHASIREVLAAKYGAAVAAGISILYGGSVKASNAVEIFGQPDVDGGLVGGASLIVDEFIQIINA
ncbi:triose-phosphate isomerase [Parasediminibacterium sp. JCM 36343]|uniref:triose-phosphate isomerase n=1 Tax=Parasediminibacterium sp. JCM 36343 TaxID=3374279 RepID=UPI0039780027